MSQEQVGTPKKYRIQTLEDLAGQIKFTRYYTQTLGEEYQAEPKSWQFVAAVNVCSALLAGELNILGIQRIIELFGEEIAIACAHAARERYLTGQTSSLAENGTKVEHTLGGTFFYLLHKWHDRELLKIAQLPKAPGAQSQLTSQASFPWPQLKIPYLYPNSAGWINPELASQKPEQVAEYNKLREELSELTTQIFCELAKASPADYEPPTASLVATFAVPASPLTSEKTSTKVQPVPRPNRTASLHSQKPPVTQADTDSSLQAGLVEAEITTLPIEKAAPVKAEEDNTN